ncbi:MAG: P1 family peptidase [Verrucomicrobia subdivision 3 bacterium]|nr:P1 family peptidase [Limisphaerales bacterium]
MRRSIWTVLVFLLGMQSQLAYAQSRAREIGVPFKGTPGRWNAITDVVGVEVGHTTLVRGDGPLKVGEGPVRTGVTVILPRTQRPEDPVFAAWFSLNGNGEMTGTTWVEESGFMEGPMAITNTHSVGVVRDAVIAWQVKRGSMHQAFALPVVAETYDGWLNDINGFHVKSEHVFQALAQASSGRVAEGNVGGGTGMNCYGFKGGIGTSSRKLSSPEGGYTAGVLVQANFGRRDQLMVAGVPVGRELGCDKVPCTTRPRTPDEGRDGSIIIVIATDAPLVAHQLKRLARRAALGIARTGGTSGNGSGDIFIAFSTANEGAAMARAPVRVTMLPNGRMDPLFDATVQATEEAIVNAMIAAATMIGRDGHRSVALPHDDLKRVLRQYNRLQDELAIRPK